MEMEKEDFVKRFKDVADFFGLRSDEYQALKVLCLGNMDAAETFILLISYRVRNDPRFDINERIQARIDADKLKAEKKDAPESGTGT